MKLTSFRVRRYRNVLDSTDVKVEDDVTTLVGMNESGKSAMLDALYRLNPVYGDTFVERDDYPRWRWKRDGRNEDLSEVSPIEATFELDKHDLAALSNALGEGVAAPKTVTAGRQYDDELWIDVPVDVDRFMRNVLQDHPEADGLLKTHGTVAALREALTPVPTPAVSDDVELSDSADDEDSEVERAAADAAALERIKTLVDAKNDLGAIARTIIRTRLPQFFRFAAYQNLEGRVDVAALRTQEDEEPGASSKQTARALLRLAETDVDSVTDAEFESRTAELEAVSSDLSREMAKYWSTNPELRIKVEIEAETVTLPQGETTVARYLNFRVEDRKHDFTNNFSLRSSGYQWFFSFLAAFSEFEERDDDVVILLDEPALTLHAKAQRDFLRFINDRLAPSGQVIYTTHSPFMVEQIERVRVVEDRGEEVGSITSSDALEVGEDSAFPLQAALGYDLSQNLFIGERNLLVEGPSDLAYLDVISRYLHDQGRDGLDDRWRVLPAGGASNVPAFVSLLGRKVSVTVLLDSGTEGGGKVEAAIKANKIDGGRVIFVGAVLDQKHSDIEDLFTAGDYLVLYNAAFNKKHKVSDLPDHPDRLLLRLEALDGKFDHWRPAEVLLRDPTKVEKLSQTTLNNFEALARKINATHT
ncbi:putative ATP-dependent endonuclease of OLD family [Promicromonospora sp. AC04]|uniref:AAA family ATPase n=1 Tax=Promicromonospora sp. AC04 TaxID=2135723 RepID=UPI000D4ED007|nr:AAA family ATPase [Promicromonospora sp. AC04]PUB32472.1 putative ATP-dependent endonuclease of OLD family [Promicromonospora sp. AC04]